MSMLIRMVDVNRNRSFFGAGFKSLQQIQMNKTILFRQRPNVCMLRLKGIAFKILGLLFSKQGEYANDDPKIVCA